MLHWLSLLDLISSLWIEAWIFDLSFNGKLIITEIRLGGWFAFSSLIHRSRVCLARSALFQRSYFRRHMGNRWAKMSPRLDQLLPPSHVFRYNTPTHQPWTQKLYPQCSTFFSERESKQSSMSEESISTRSCVLIWMLTFTCTVSVTLSSTV